MGYSVRQKFSGTPGSWFLPEGETSVSSPSSPISSEKMIMYWVNYSRNLVYTVHFNMIQSWTIPSTIMFSLKPKLIVMLKKLSKHWEGPHKIVILLKVEFQIGEHETFNSKIFVASLFEDIDALFLVSVDSVPVQTKVSLLQRTKKRKKKKKNDHHHQILLSDEITLVQQVHRIIY